MIDAPQARDHARARRVARAHLGALGHRREAAAGADRATLGRPLLLVARRRARARRRGRPGRAASATSSSPAPTSGSAARAAPGSSGRVDWDRDPARRSRASRCSDDAPAARFTPGGCHSFEHRWALAQAFEYQSKLGRAAVAEHVHALAQRLKDGLAELPARAADHAARRRGLRPGSSASRSTGWTPRTAVARLLERRIRASVTPVRGAATCGSATSLHVDERDVDAAVGSVKALRG